MADDTEKDNGDYLGYGVYARTLWARIQAALDKDLATGKAPGDDPLVVGIFGEWGAGKSTLLKQTFDLAADFQAQRSRSRSGAEGGFGDPGFGLTVPVLFQPWKYEHEPHLLVPLLLHIIQALRDSIPKAQTMPEKAEQAAEKVWAASVGALPNLVKGFEQIYKATVADFAMVDPATAAGASVGFKTAGWLAKWLKRPDDADWLRDFKFSSEGRFYYNFHNVMLTLTRPGKRAEAIGALKFDPTARINFVIFIDDLDRCLPEKAVETLELIKTVFNLESFAFVLALDEEVVERGIGHRYKDYALVNKKPEMPITGFEYLEKIVHLPFRLPPLTARQAMLFVRRHEAAIQPDAQRRWFDAPSVVTKTGSKEDGEEVLRVRGIDAGQQLDLLPLVLSCFDHFVPRKLIRLVELMKQLTDVTDTVGRRAIDRRYGGQLDPRVVIALVLLQLFAPELYRFLRRRPEAFSTFLSAFAPNASQPLGHHVSDADLCDWVVPPVAKRRAALIQNERGLTGLMERLSSDIATHWDKPRERANAQNIRLPLVRLLLEHRALHRNVFDPVKLFQVLAAELQHTGQNPAAVVLRPYLSLLTEKVERKADEPRAYRHRVHQLEAFFDDMVFDEAPVRANILARHDVPEDAFLSRQTVQGLMELISKRFYIVSEVTTAFEGEGISRALATERANILHALLQLDEAIAGGDRLVWAEILELFQGSYETPSPAVGLDNPSASAHFWELQSRWGFDKRFDKDAPGLPTERWPANEDATSQEPIKGFVRVEPEKDFGIGSEHDSDNPPNTATLKNPFYMARFLTTVGQYKHFVDDGGYTNKDWWDEQGRAWKAMQWASETNEPDLRQWLDERTQEQRTQPTRWKEQLRSPSQPVWGVNWFEARAYARWLTAQLQPRLTGDLRGFVACLPTEWQWERVARFGDEDHTSDHHQYPGGLAEDDDVHRLANIHGSGIGSCSVVGCFAPNALGIHDLHGNLLEWQDNLYTSEPLHLGCQRLARSENPATHTEPGQDWLKTHEKWTESDRPALRGGSWGDAAGFARASFRSWNPPDVWDDSIGFRVVLSLANLNSET
ncbi:SUMF1/EgtB/PvdO family nonheme iron enzyme [Hydrogenophaga taeniospiralis]|uniref:SUMF1/EgtB/PvdO family nonheme iron enzyme n=1 Tax=Hydrogenophaga taeniospiralis TaxID=65656 RepID=UPI001CFA13EF|nr:SUMF1/EgtB/PvdO family nonheme iron enzyme [Hydrogenophaga taeniospiralis]MCB4363877.1 SUMF1/EgtB/PvdO family nonheme iron enzyme [Hydrogenophaga taeniospiralis]